MNMKKIFWVTASALVLGNSMTVFAAPELMADGTVFDAEYYAQANPDVAAVYGTDKNALFTHYTMFGKAEGRTACADTAPETPSNQADLDKITSSNESVIKDDETHPNQTVVVLSGDSFDTNLDPIIGSVKDEALKKELSPLYYYYW